MRPQVKHAATMHNLAIFLQLPILLYFTVQFLSLPPPNQNGSLSDCDAHRCCSG